MPGWLNQSARLIRNGRPGGTIGADGEEMDGRQIRLYRNCTFSHASSMETNRPTTSAANSLPIQHVRRNVFTIAGQAMACTETGLYINWPAPTLSRNKCSDRPWLYPSRVVWHLKILWYFSWLTPRVSRRLKFSGMVSLVFALWHSKNLGNFRLGVPPSRLVPFPKISAKISATCAHLALSGGRVA